ncbi:MAG: D-alanyl-D-alanine carboxypeptidase [Alphaproteobacteria bacterium]|nr:D-alanyl-D-alanine carboxypeptidase [Alphaproteobacteria bacterium]MBQ8368236.1 D-alanyl-D-alanine carboxypeptidase [Alphaproteobacteria bacterium]
MKKKIIAVFLALVAGAANAGEFKTKAKSAFLIDYDSGAEIVAKNADTLMPPSSMIKLMTLAVLFDELKAGNITMDTRFPVGENADYNRPEWYPASKICLTAGQTISVRDLILGLIVLSGGDASVVVAEKLAGSESAFTAMMEKKARSIGMEQSTFGNASGLPDPNNLMTSRELAILAEHLITDYPDIYPMFATKRFEFKEHQTDWCREWGRTHTVNYNKLLFNMRGADGLKTGHTADGGYGMVASAKIGGRRLIGVINGFNGKGHEALAGEMKKLLEHGFATTTNKVFYSPNDAVAEIPVWYGRQPTVVATVGKPFAITVDKEAGLKGVRVLARYDEPLMAPVRAGDEIGQLIAEQNGNVIARAPLIAKDKVGKIQFVGRIIKNIKVMFGWE